MEKIVAVVTFTGVILGLIVNIDYIYSKDDLNIKIDSIKSEIDSFFASGGIQITDADNSTKLIRPTDLARSKLRQLGVQWSLDNFIGAIVDGDVRSVELFLKGGMKYNLNYKGASAAVYMLQPGANNRQAIMGLFLNYGFDPNAPLIDGRIMRSFGSIPPHFEHRLLPKRYSAWQKVFAGPSGLWIVIRASYAGPERNDILQLRQLAAGGAKFDLSIAFLKEFEKSWGDTPVYWEIRNEIEHLRD